MATILPPELVATCELFHAVTEIDTQKHALWDDFGKSPLTRIIRRLLGPKHPSFRTHFWRFIRRIISVCNTAKRAPQAAGNQQGLQHNPASPFQARQVRAIGSKIEIPS